MATNESTWSNPSWPPRRYPARVGGKGGAGALFRSLPRLAARWAVAAAAAAVTCPPPELSPPRLPCRCNGGRLGRPEGRRPVLVTGV